MGRTYIIAKYKEDTAWADDLNKVIITKDVELPNEGREVSSYLYFIINNYDSLKGNYVFCQGNPYDHDPDFPELRENIYTSDLNGSPDHPGLEIEKLAKMLELDIPDKLQFKPGAQFEVSAEQIKKRPLNWYKKAYEISMKEKQAP